MSVRGTGLPDYVGRSVRGTGFLLVLDCADKNVRGKACLAQQLLDCADKNVRVKSESNTLV